MREHTLSVPFVLATLLVGAALVGASAALAEEAAPPAVVHTATATRELLRPRLWVPGTVVSRQDSAVAAEVEGRLVAVREEGERVARGDVLGEIDDAPFQIQLRSDDAAIAALETRIAWLERQEQRFQTLALTQSTAASELDRLVMDRRMAEHDLAAAEARREQTLYRIEKARITAPFDGVVVRRSRQPGEYIAAGTPLLRLVNDRALEARMTAPIDVVRHIEEGQTVPVAADGTTTTDSTLQAPVRAVVPVGDARTRTAELLLTLDDARHRWISGEAIRAALPNGAAQDAVTVPRDALVLRDGQVFVYRIGAEGNAERVRVVAGDGGAERVAVTGGVRAGDQVVVRGAERLRDGQAVRVLSALGDAVATR